MKCILYFLEASIITSLMTLRFLYVSSKKEKLYREEVFNNREEKSLKNEEKTKALVKIFNY